AARASRSRLDGGSEKHDLSRENAFLDGRQRMAGRLPYSECSWTRLSNVVWQRNEFCLFQPGPAGASGARPAKPVATSRSRVWAGGKTSIRFANGFMGISPGDRFPIGRRI